jgi:hypothetical protein
MIPNRKSALALRLFTISAGCGVASLFVMVFANYAFGVNPLAAQRLTIVVAPLWAFLIIRELRKSAGLQ